MPRRERTPFNERTKRPSRQGEIRLRRQAAEQARMEQVRREQQRGMEQARREQARREQVRMEQDRREQAKREKLKKKKLENQRQYERMRAAKEEARRREQEEAMRREQEEARRREQEEARRPQRGPILTPSPLPRKKSSPSPPRSSQFGWQDGEGPGLLLTPKVPEVAQKKSADALPMTATKRAALASANRKTSARRINRKRRAPKTNKSVKKRPGKVFVPNKKSNETPAQQKTTRGTGLTTLFDGMRIGSPRRKKTQGGDLVSSPSAPTPRKPKGLLPSTLGQPPVW